MESFAEISAASTRISLERVPGKAMAFDEYFIHQVSGLAAAAGWLTRPER